MGWRACRKRIQYICDTISSTISWHWQTLKFTETTSDGLPSLQWSAFLEIGFCKLFSVERHVCLCVRIAPSDSQESLRHLFAEHSPKVEIPACEQDYWLTCNEYRLSLPLVCKKWNQISASPELWQSAYLWLHDEHEEFLNTPRSGRGVLANCKANLRELEIEFPFAKSCLISGLLGALGGSNSLTKLVLKGSSQRLCFRGSEYEETGLLVMCAVASLTALQTLSMKGFPVRHRTFGIRDLQALLL